MKNHSTEFNMVVTTHTWPLLESAGIIGDSTTECTYTSVLASFQILDELFYTREHSVQSCISIFAGNTAGHAIAILYLIHKRINFFLGSSDMITNTSIPDFSDKILHVETIKEAGGTSFNYNITSNPAFQAKGGLLSEQNGLAAFSSSGSTGTPKFICYQVEKLLRNIDNCVQHFGIKNTSRVLIPVPVSHMFGLGVGFLPAIRAGASICLIEKNNVLRFLDKIQLFKPDMVLVNPTFCKMLLQLDKPFSFKGTFISAGETMKPSVHKAFTEKFGHLVNLYGCTEMGAMATTHVAKSDGIPPVLLVEPLKDVSFRQTNNDTREILCSYTAGFDCYIDHTGARMDDQPFEDGWYKTRDAGRCNEYNQWEITGRIDLCINRSGFLLSLQELETQLTAILHVIEQVVVVESGEHHLFAVCQLKEAHNLTSELARKACMDKLPRYAIPDTFLFTKELPRLYNGKFDRQTIKNNFLK
jgi:acyl-coenzyme A synthetase/AMP-(fatty) acid ligase